MNHRFKDGHYRRTAEDGKDEKNEDESAVFIHDYLVFVS